MLIHLSHPIPSHPTHQIRQLWALCDPEGRGFLGRPQFHLAMRLLAMAQVGYIDPIDPTLPGRIQARDPLSVALPQLPPVRLMAAAPPTEAAAMVPSPPMQMQPQQREEEDEFGDFEGAAAPPAPLAAVAAPAIPSPPLQAATAAMSTTLSAGAAVEVEEEEDDDFGDFHAAEAEAPEAAVVASVAVSAFTVCSTSSSTGTTSTVKTAAAATAMLTRTTATMTTGLAMLSSSSSQSTTTITTTVQAPADMAARMAAFDAIVEEHDWGDFEEAGPAPEAPAPGPALLAAAGATAAATARASPAVSALMGFTGEDTHTTPFEFSAPAQAAISFGGAVLPSTGGGGGGGDSGGGLLDLDLLGAAAPIDDPFAAVAGAPSGPPPFGGADVTAGLGLGGSIGAFGTSRFMTETPPSSPKQLTTTLPSQYRSSSPPLPTIHGLGLDHGPHDGNPFTAAALAANPAAPAFVPSTSGGGGGGGGSGLLDMGDEGAGIGGSGSSSGMVGLAGVGIGTGGSIYEMSPYADPDAVAQSLSPSPPLAEGVGSSGVAGGEAEKEDALTSAFREADAASSGADMGLGGLAAMVPSRSHTTGPLSPPPASPSLPSLLTAPAPSSAVAVADPFGFSGADTSFAAAAAPVFGGNGGGDAEWGGFSGGDSAAAAPAPSVFQPLALAPLSAATPVANQGQEEDDPFAGLGGHGEEGEEEEGASSAIQHEEVSPSSQGSSSLDRPLWEKAAADEEGQPQQQQQQQQPEPEPKREQEGKVEETAAAAAEGEEEEEEEWGAFSSAAGKEAAPASASVPLAAPTLASSVGFGSAQQESADPWSHPDPWATEAAQPLQGSSGGGSGTAGASASSSILLSPVHVAPPSESVAPAVAVAAAPPVAEQAKEDEDEDEDEEERLAAVLVRLWAKGLLGPAAALTEHLEAQAALPVAAGEYEAAKREDRLEEALALKRRMRELEGRAAGGARVAAWRQQAEAAGAAAGGEEEDDALLQRLRQQVEEGAGAERAGAFAQAFILGQPSLAAQAQGGDRRGALRRARCARRCAALVVGLGVEGEGGPLAAYPEHWRRTLATAEGKLREAAGFCQRVRAIPSAETRREVGASLKVKTFVEAALEIVRVARFVRAVAGEALLPPAETAEGDGDGDEEALAAELREAAGEMGLEAVAAAWPLDVGGVRDAVAEYGGAEEEGDDAAAAASIDPRSVCNLCLLPLAAARALGGKGAHAHAPVPVTYFSGAAYHAPCCSFWLGGISLEPPRPWPSTAKGDRDWARSAAGLGGDAMDGSSGSTNSEGAGSEDAAPASDAHALAVAQEVPF